MTDKKRLQTPWLIAKINPYKSQYSADKGHEKRYSESYFIHDKIILSGMIFDKHLFLYPTSNIAGSKNQTKHYNN